MSKQSDYNALPESIRDLETGESGVGGQTLKFKLDREHFVKEHLLFLVVSQAFTGVPTSVREGKFIENIILKTDKRTLIDCSGKALYPLSRVTEAGIKSRVTLAATSVCTMGIDLHHILDGAKEDLATGLETSEYNQITLVVKLADDADNGFIGGTVPLAASYDLAVTEKSIPGFTGFGIPQGYRTIQEADATVTKTGWQPKHYLETGVQMRFLQMQAETAAGLVSDSLIDEIAFDVGEGIERKISFQRLQMVNEGDRDLTLENTGLAYIDGGDELDTMIDLRSITKKGAYIKVKTTTNTGVINYTQDSVKMIGEAG